MTIKMSDFDRLQAIARNPEYIKDYKELCPIPFSSSSPFFEKWDSQPVDKDKENAFKENWPGCDTVMPPDEIKALIRDDPFVMAMHTDIVTVSVYEDIKITKNKSRKAGRRGFTIDFSPNLRDKKYLTLEIDITGNDDEIIEYVKRRLDFYRNSIGFKKGAGRRGKTELNPWTIYDRVHDNRENRNQIAKNLSGIDENPTYNDTVRAMRRKVDRAYNKALEMIEEVEK